MKTLFRSIFLVAFVTLASVCGFAQTATPHTTLCAAQTAASKYVCLTATTNVVGQTGVYVDNEYELVVLTSGQTVCTGPCSVPVSRATRMGGGPPAAHANATTAWLALVPGQSTIPGVNGFISGTQFGDVGTCTRTAEVYLPHIWPSRGLKRDCSVFGQWVDYAGLGNPVEGGIQIITGDATISTAGNYILTKGSAAAITLTAPTAGIEDGAIVRIFTGTAQLHVVTATGLIYSGNTQTGVLTFTANIGCGVVLMAYNGHWILISNNNVTLTS